MNEPCPACGVRPDAQAVVPWGDAVQRLPAVPWICASCGALALLSIATGRLTATTEEDWEPVRQQNPTLWAAIMQARALIRWHTEEDFPCP